MIRITGLNILLETFKIKDLNLLIEDGEFHILLGPTGSGKTIILESIVGLRKITDGIIAINENEIQHLPPEKRLISYVPQDLALFPHMTVMENILYGVKAQKLNLAEYDSYIKSLIDSVMIGHLLDRTPLRLSGGEKQRVALVRALAPKPKLLMLDEPLSSLDPGLRKEIQKLLLHLHKTFNLTILHVTHDFEESYFLGEKLSIIINGKIEQQGSKKEVLLFPRSLPVASFLGLPNIFESSIIDVSPIDKHFSIIFGNKEIKLTHHQTNKFPERGDCVWIFIRPEEVMIIREGKDIKSSLRKNIFDGIIAEINDRGTYRNIKFKPDMSDYAIEINIPNYVFRNLNLFECKKTKIALREESFWVIKNS